MTEATSPGSVSSSPSDSPAPSSSIPAGHTSEPTFAEARSALYSDESFMNALLNPDSLGHAAAIRRRAELFRDGPSGDTLDGKPVDSDDARTEADAAEGARGEIEFAPAMSKAEYDAIDLGIVRASPMQETDPKLEAFAKHTAAALEMDAADLRNIALNWNLKGAALERGESIDFEGERAASMADLARQYGDRLPAKIALAKRAIAQADPSGNLAYVLAESGVGNSLPAIRAFIRVGERLEAKGKFKK